MRNHNTTNTIMKKLPIYTIKKGFGLTGIGIKLTKTLQETYYKMFTPKEFEMAKMKSEKCNSLVTA